MSTISEELAELPEWRIRINDGFCEYEFMLKATRDCCINDVAKAAAAALGAELTKGILTQPWSGNLT